MKRESVSIYNPDMPDNLKGEALKKNSEALNNVANNRAAQILVDFKYTATKSVVTTAAYAVIPEFSKTFASSGGLIFICVQLTGSAGGTVMYSGAIEINGEIKAASTGYGNVSPIIYVGTLAKGNCAIQIKLKSVGDDTFSLNHANSAAVSTLRVAEVIL